MPEISIGPASAFADPGRRVLEVDGVEIGVFQVNGKFRAYENICPHLGGPVCQGKVFPRAREDVGTDRRSHGITFAKDEINIICPWHGYEYNIETGQHQGNAKLRLRPIKVRIENGEVLVAVPERR